MIEKVSYKLLFKNNFIILIYSNLIIFLSNIPNLKVFKQKFTNFFNYYKYILIFKNQNTTSLIIFYLYKS